MNEQSRSYAGLLGLSAQTCVLEAAQPLAALLCVRLLAHASKDPQTNTDTVAAYAAVETSVTFVLGVFQFLLIVTMTQTSKARARGNVKVLRSKVTTAFSTAVFLGGVSAGLLFLLRGPVLSAFSLQGRAAPLAKQYMKWRIASMPLMFIQRVASGLLGGFQWLKSLVCLKVLNALLYVAGVSVALYGFNEDLSGCGIGILAAIGLATIALVIAALAATSTFRGSEQSVRVESEDKPATPKDTGAKALVCSWIKTWSAEYARKSGNMFVRSILLQGTVLSLSVAASQFGNHTLAAHQVVLQLWMVTSYICDGFADVATMVGAEEVQKDNIAVLSSLCRRLTTMTALCGALAAEVLFIWQDQIIGQFTSDTQTWNALATVWPVLAAMQLVFLFDGFLYAFEAYAFTRNVMLVGFFLLYLPALLIGVCYFKSWLSVWVAKAILNSWRCGSAVFYVRARSWGLDIARQKDPAAQPLIQ